MTRRERICRSMPSSWLRFIMGNPLMRSWWSAAFLELWKRDVEDVMAEIANDEDGPWIVSPIMGMH